MASLPADTLKNRSFICLITAQFLASFNDQAIHAAAMFYAIHQEVLTEGWAITLLPILFFLPWAIFVTASAYFADRFSKTTSIRIWKFIEIPIALLLMFGFWFGDRSQGNFGVTVGTYCVLAGVFLMGTHAAFFSPAKYGAMPEILQPHLLSRGNGILESSTFLANIFGTVAGGMLSHNLRGHEIWIGVILLGLAVVGAVFSMFIERLPASDPTKRFDLIKPLVNGARDVFGSRPLVLGVLGIAFFVFMATFMRSTMYMHGQTRVPPWNEFKTSLIVATVALGVGLGSPMAGWLSGGKIELGLVPIGCIGMILGSVIAAILLNAEYALVVSLIILGFFSGFYMVPLYAILQHRAPKKSKGEIIAVSNFINVIGAMAAPLLFAALFRLGDLSGLTPVIQPGPEIRGTVVDLKRDHGHIEWMTIRTEDGDRKLSEDGAVMRTPKGGVTKGMDVAVATAHLRQTDYYWVRPADEPDHVRHNHEALPRYLFLAAAIMAFGVLLALWRLLPDFPVRTLFGWVTLGRFQLKAVGMSNLPMSGPVVLATNCDRLESSLQVVSATDRDTLVVMVEPHDAPKESSLLRRLALRTDLVAVRPPPPPTEIVAGNPSAVSAHREQVPPVTVPDLWAEARKRATKEVKEGNLLAVTVNGSSEQAQVGTFLNDLRNGQPIPVVPVWCGPLPQGNGKQIRVVFGEPVCCPAGVDVGEIRKKIDALGEWIREHDGTPAAHH